MPISHDMVAGGHGITTKADDDWKEVNTKLGYAMKYLRQRGDASPSQTAFIEAIDKAMAHFWEIKGKNPGPGMPGESLATAMNIGLNISFARIHCSVRLL